MIALFRKEINQYFGSLTGLLTIILFLLVNALFLWIFSGDFNLLGQSATCGMNVLASGCR